MNLVEIDRAVVQSLDSAYRIVQYHPETPLEVIQELPPYPYSVEYAPLLRDGAISEQEWNTIGGTPGLPNADFRTLNGARAFLQEIVAKQPDEEVFWAILERLEGK